MVKTGIKPAYPSRYLLINNPPNSANDFSTSPVSASELTITHPVISPYTCIGFITDGFSSVCVSVRYILSVLSVYIVALFEIFSWSELVIFLPTKSFLYAPATAITVSLSVIIISFLYELYILSTNSTTKSLIFWTGEYFFNTTLSFPSINISKLLSPMNGLMENNYPTQLGYEMIGKETINIIMRSGILKL